MQLQTRILIAVVVASSLRCASTGPAPPPEPDPNRGVVILVPGMTGSRLCSRATGEVLWGSIGRLVRPWDGGAGIARNLDGGDDDVTPCGPILEMRILQWRKDIYGGLIAFLKRERYDVQFFDHDWRMDNVVNARLLVARLSQLEGRRVQLICQSNGAYICRYALKYGDVSIEEAERGVRRPARTRVDKVILIGTANGGALRILRELNRGRQYIRLFGRRFRPDVFFSLQSIYQDLPVYTNDLFVDEDGRPVAIDLFDAANWRKYRWSVYASGSHDLDREDQHLLMSLTSAKRMHALLRADSGTPLPPYYSIQSRDFPTAARARITRDGRTRMPPEDKDGTLSSPGDVHATAESQSWLSGEERRASAEDAVIIPGRHFEMITTERARSELRRILSAVVW